MPSTRSLNIRTRKPSLSLLLQPVHDIRPMMTAQTLAVEKLRNDVDMAVFQELLDLDTSEDIFSKDVVQEYLVLAPEILLAMSESLHHRDLSQLGKASQSLRCASMVLGLTRIEKSCARVETILALGVDLHYSGIGLSQICDILHYVMKDAQAYFVQARLALTNFYGLPLVETAASDVSDDF